MIDHRDDIPNILSDVDDEPLISQRVAVRSNSNDSVASHSNWMTHTVPGWSETVKIALMRLRNTQGCLSLYVVLMLLNLFLLIWEVFGGHRGLTVIVIEIVINFMLVAEVSVGIITQRWQYWQSWANRADFIVTIVCVAFFVLYIEEEGLGGVDDNMSISETVLVGIRYLVQICRLVFLAFRGQWSHELLGQDDVDFSLVYDDDADDDIEMTAAPIARDGGNMMGNSERQHLIGSTDMMQKLRKQLESLEHDIDSLETTGAT